ncbi:hypothetical protein D3C76_1830680 [compost metagenome]
MISLLVAFPPGIMLARKSFTCSRIEKCRRGIVLSFSTTLLKSSITWLHTGTVLSIHNVVKRCWPSIRSKRRMP